MRVTPALLCLTLWHTACPAQARQPAYPPYSIFNTEIRFLYSAAAGRVYKIFVNLPRAYHQEPERRYPTLYILDPAAHFGMVTDMQRLFEDGRRIEPVITIGVGYETILSDSLGQYREHDMTPTRVHPNSGGGPAFLTFIETELIPFVEAQYRVDPGIRGYWGGSYGGLFGAYALLARPGLFQRMILTSPTVAWDGDALFKREQALADTADALPTLVYIAAGGAEDEGWMLGPLRRFVAQLKSRGYEGLQIDLDIVPGEDHFSIAPLGIARGLMRMFARPPEEHR
ncbi:MAG: alpha/beta hydrolase-fold protein [Gemmatimonadota bacterium]